jgi:SAM-dependent methyltransferase
MKNDFNKFAKEYNFLLNKQLKTYVDDVSLFAKYKVDICKKTFPRNPKLILEFGCGTGRNLPFLKSQFPEAKIYGFDISADSIKVAKKFNPDVSFIRINSKNFKLPTKIKFDFIFVANVFHHIDPEIRRSTLTEIYNLLDNKGFLYIFEHNPWNPLTQKLVRECPLDVDASLIKMHEMRELLLSANFKITINKYTLFSKPNFKLFSLLENFFGWLPLGAQYFIQAKKN